MGAMRGNAGLPTAAQAAGGKAKRRGWCRSTLTVEQIGGRLRVALGWVAAGVAVAVGAVGTVVVFDRIGLMWSCSARLGVVGTALAWLAVTHHVLGALWVWMVLLYPARYFGRKRRGYTGVGLAAYGVAVLWVVAVSC